MADLPYTYTDVDGDALRIGRGNYTAYDPSSGNVVGIDTPTGDAAVAVARAILAAAGNTGHEVVDTEENNAVRARGFELTSENRQLLQQRADLRRERDGAFEAGARSMRERAAACAEDDPTADYDIRRQILALPLLPSDGDTPVYESPQELVQEIERLREENTRLTRERDVAARELGKALTAERAEHLDVKFDGTRRRVGALEQQYTDLANLVHGHGEDLARLRCRFTEEDDG